MENFNVGKMTFVVVTQILSIIFAACELKTRNLLLLLNTVCVGIKVFYSFGSSGCLNCYKTLQAAVL